MQFKTISPKWSDGADHPSKQSDILVCLPFKIMITTVIWSESSQRWGRHWLVGTFRPTEHLSPPPSPGKSVCVCVCVCVGSCSVVQCIKPSVYWSSLGKLVLIIPPSTLIHCKAASYQLARMQILLLLILLLILLETFLELYRNIGLNMSGANRLGWDSVKIWQG